MSTTAHIALLAVPVMHCARTTTTTASTGTTMRAEAINAAQVVLAMAQVALAMRRR